MKEILFSIGVVMGILACVFVPLFTLGAVADKASCSATASKMRLEHSWGIMQGCMVNVRGQWYPIGAVQYTNGHMEVYNVQ